MSQRRLLLESPLLEIMTSRLCQQLIENHGDFADSAILGLQPRGIYLAARMHRELEGLISGRIPFGVIDATFHRDDFRRRESVIRPNETRITFALEQKRVILIDDVLATGRMVRAALDAITFFGRPRTVELCVLINRHYSRHLPIAADYVGMHVNTLASQRVLVEWTEQGHQRDTIWLAD